jgi:hypothetical protein
VAAAIERQNQVAAALLEYSILHRYHTLGFILGIDGDFMTVTMMDGDRELQMRFDGFDYLVSSSPDPVLTDFPRLALLVGVRGEPLPSIEYRVFAENIAEIAPVFAIHKSKVLRFDILDTLNDVKLSRRIHRCASRCWIAKLQVQ